MNKPAEVKDGRLYVYGVHVATHDMYYATEYAQQINKAFRQRQEDAKVAVRAGGCA